jgi:hypothetical protein
MTSRRQLEAIKQTKVDLNVYLANYNNADDNGVAYLRQRALIMDAINTYGTDQIAGNAQSLSQFLVSI